MAIVTPAPRIGKTAGPAMPKRSKGKPAAKPRKPKQTLAIPPVAPGLINR